MIVCVCHRVSDAQIVAHACGGCASFEQLQGDLRVATACGCCHDCARSTFEAARIGRGGGGATSPGPGLAEGPVVAD